jgi:CheY-like chemotaxis protein
MTTRLLIADMDAESRTIYERLSSVLGFPVETAADGLECWAKLQIHTPEVLVIDRDIPWGGADGVLARLREDLGDLMHPAIFLTADDPPEALSREFGIAIGRCFQKPFRMNELLASVCETIAGRQYRQHAD